MQESLKVVLKIQEIDIKMIRLIRVKKERQNELEKIHSLKTDIGRQVDEKEKQILDLKKEIRLGETQIKEIQDKVAKLESQQAAVKKMDEFNALTQEMTAAGKERHVLELRVSDMMDKLATEEDVLITLRENFRSTEESSQTLEKEIRESIVKINEEGMELLKERQHFIPNVQQDTFKIYERLLKNKKDRVLVPIENRTCSGCHIVLTAQHENMVRKGDRLVFCEHCSRILYWQDVEPVEGDGSAKRRRRKATTAV